MVTKIRDRDDLVGEINIYVALSNSLMRLRRSVLAKEYTNSDGICFFVQSNASERYLHIGTYLSDMYPKWPEWSGSYAFPVPPHKGCKNRLHCSYAYHNSDYQSMWYTGEYAEMRMSLLNFLIRRSKSIIRRRRHQLSLMENI